MSKKRKNTAGAKKEKANKSFSAKKNDQVKTGYFWPKHWKEALLLFFLPFLLYGISIKYGYVLDDKLVLSENNFVKKGFAGIGDIFTNETFTGYLGEQQDLVVGARYRPLSMATFAVEHQFLGLNPNVSHFLNILFYALSGLLLFRVLALFLPQRKDQGWYLKLPFLAALLFIAHPIHTEVVANIKGRDEILMLLLTFGAFYFSYRYIASNKTIPLILSGVVFFIALMAKENAVTFLAVIPLAFYLFTKTDWKHIGISLLPLATAFVVYLVVRMSVIGYLLDSGKEITGIMNNPFYGVTAGERFAMISYTLGKYLQLLFFPHPLTHDYYPYQVPIINWADWRAILPLLLNAGLLAVAVRWFKKQPVISWSILYYFATLSIVSNIVFTVGAPMNERFLYLSSVGFCVAFAWLIVELLPKWLKLSAPRNAQFSMVLLGIVLFGYSLKTITRVPAWENEMTLNRAAIKVSKNSARANSYMAYSLYRASLEEPDQARKRAMLDEALPLVNRALEIYPEYTDALTCKGGVVSSYYQMDGNLDQLLEEFYQILAARHVSFIDQYVEYLNGRADPQKMLNFYHRVGYELFLQTKKNYPLAIKYLNYGLQVAPGNITLLEDLTEAYFLAGQPNNANATAQRALQVSPNSQRIRVVLSKMQ